MLGVSARRPCDEPAQYGTGVVERFGKCVADLNSRTAMRDVALQRSLQRMICRMGAVGHRHLCPEAACHLSSRIELRETRELRICAGVAVREVDRGKGNAGGSYVSRIRVQAAEVLLQPKRPCTQIGVPEVG